MKINRFVSARLVAGLIPLMLCAGLLGCGSKHEDALPPPPAASAAAPGTASAAPTGPAATITKEQQDAMKMENSDGGKSP